MSTTNTISELRKTINDQRKRIRDLELLPLVGSETALLQARIRELETQLKNEEVTRKQLEFCVSDCVARNNKYRAMLAGKRAEWVFFHPHSSTPPHKDTIVDGFCAVTGSWGTPCKAGMVPWEGINHVTVYRILKEVDEK